MQALVRIAAVALLVLSLGLQWVLLQSVAWVGMLANYSRDASFSEAVSKTFDGKHPCCLCKAIKEGRGAEKKQDQQQAKSGSKLEVGLVWDSVRFDFECDREAIVVANFSSPSRAGAPPKPPPRGFSS